MSSTVLYMSMSLDGFVASPNETRGRRTRDSSKLRQWRHRSCATRRSRAPSPVPASETSCDTASGAERHRRTATVVGSDSGCHTHPSDWSRVTGAANVPLEVIAQLRSVCLALPEAYEQPAWVGTRWRIRTKTFAHVLTVVAGRPPAYARAAGSSGPITVITFRSPGAEVDALSTAGYPFFWCGWGRDVLGMVLDEHVDWDEVAELLTESYCFLAPNKLVKLIDCSPN